MGMYTGLRFEAVLNEQGKEVISWLHTYRKAPEWAGWEEASKAFPQYDWVGMWSGIGRCNFIPWGSICYVGWWCGDDMVDEFDGTTWRVVCSLKNYQGEIQFFLDRILPFMLARPCIAETLYEQQDAPTLHEVRPLPGLELLSPSGTPLELSLPTRFQGAES